MLLLPDRCSSPAVGAAETYRVMTHRLVRVPRWDLYLLLLVIPEQRRGHLRDDLYFRPHACSLSYGPVGALVRWPSLGVSCHAAVIWAMRGS